MAQEPVDRKQLLGRLLPRVCLGFLGLGGLLFGAAGSLAYWNAWLFLLAMLAVMLPGMAWLLVRDPELLAKRLRVKEERPTQRRFALAALPLLLVAFVLPGLDFRFGWSRLPPWLVGLAAMLLLLGFGLFVLVLRHNRYASRVVEIQEGQALVDTGPYARVRHPMYSSVVLIYLACPLLLGSWPALIAFGAFLALLPVRILNEEKLLLQELGGYRDYCLRVRWRLIPGLW